MRFSHSQVTAANEDGQSTSTSLAVHVTGVNEYSPRFSDLTLDVIASASTQPGNQIF